jgi:hypothetical protein
MMNFKKGVFRFIDETETLQSDDLGRPLYFVSDLGWSDNKQEGDYKCLRWTPISELLPAWVGNTLLDLHNFPDRDNGPYIQEYEVMRRMA